MKKILFATDFDALMKMKSIGAQHNTAEHAAESDKKKTSVLKKAENVG
jgi:hypothetical protein